MASNGISESTCIQRKMRMMFPNPPTRATITSPYNLGYSKYELDMRRKAEILQYSGPRSSSQGGNRLTRKELFAQTARGYNPLQRTAQRATPEQLAFCDSKNYKTISTQANVPGPQISLYLDKTIPLYMYTKSSTVDQPPSETSNTTDEDIPFVFYVVTDNNTSSTTTLFEANQIQPIGVLEVRTIQPNAFYTFTLNFTTTTIITSIPSFKLQLNNSPVIQSIVPTVSITSDDVSNTSAIQIQNITIPVSQPYFYEFFIQFAADTTVTISSINVIQTS